MAKDLDIAAVLGAQLGKVSGPDTSGRERIEYIDIDLLEQDPDNFYQLSKVDELAGNISVVGLQQPIRVRPSEGGRYMIVSGHRRRAALQQLVESGEDLFRQVPCIVEPPAGSAAMQKLRLIYANADTRTMTSAELGQQVKEVEDLLYQLKDEGMEFKGKMRDHVAQICNVKATKLANLKVIREKLASCWQPWYKKGKLNETVALTLARMPEAHQRMIFETRKGENPTDYLWEGTADKMGRRMAEADKVTCSPANGGQCVNQERRYKRICTQSEWGPFNCGKCCAECSELGTCKYACKLLEGKVKNIKASNRIIRQNEQREKEERERPAVNQIKALWNRFGEARNAADKTVEDCYKAAKMFYSASDEQKTEVMECLEGKYTPDTTLPYGYSCQLHHAQQFIRMADLFGCSVDYLLCRTDVPQMATAAPEPEGQLVFAGWTPGGATPKEPCDVVAKFDMGTEKLHSILCRWNGKEFVFKGGEKLAMEPVKWMALPEEDV